MLVCVRCLYFRPRKYWEDCSGKRTAFDVNAAAQTLVEGLVREAKTLYANRGGVARAARRTGGAGATASVADTGTQHELPQTE